MMIRIRGRCFSFFYLVDSMQIVFEHPWFLVVNKPTDLLTQAVEGIPSVQTTLVSQLISNQPTGPTPFIGIPHRLDRVTTGVMVVARNQRALRRLSEQFAARRVRKKYHAIVETTDEIRTLECGERQLRWVDYLRKIPDESRGEICDSSVDGAREAVLSFRRLGNQHLCNRTEGFSLVEIELETGRMHQIRLQFASRGAPVVGDSLYGSHVHWIEGEFRQPPIALHARSLEFFHPQTAEKLFFEADYPEFWPTSGPT